MCPSNLMRQSYHARKLTYTAGGALKVEKVVICLQGFNCATFISVGRPPNGGLTCIDVRLEQEQAMNCDQGEPSFLTKTMPVIYHAVSGMLQTYYVRTANERQTAGIHSAHLIPDCESERSPHEIVQ